MSEGFLSFVVDEKRTEKDVQIEKQIAATNQGKARATFLQATKQQVNSEVKIMLSNMQVEALKNLCRYV